jgi:hypothetical protein
MSVQALLSAAMVQALRDHAGLADVVTGVFDAPPVRAARAYAVVEEALLGDWSTKDMAGREGRLAVTLYDGGERPVRLRALAGEAEAAIDAMPRDIGGGWRVVTLVFVRGRIVREGDGRWAAMSEWRVRMLRES